MNKCNFHQQTDAKRVCTKCGKSFCDECAKQTDYTGRCIECESKVLASNIKLCTKKQISYLSSFFACLVGVVIFWLFYLNFNDFKLAGKAGALLLGMFGLLFGVFSFANGFKIKRLKRVLKKLKDYHEFNK